MKKKMMNALMTLVVALAFVGCATDGDEADVLSGDTSQALATYYGSKQQTGSGPLMYVVGVDYTQYIKFNSTFDSNARYDMCGALGCTSQAYTYELNPTANPYGYNVMAYWGNPSAGPGNSFGTLNVKLCMDLENSILIQPTLQFGCTDVTPSHNVMTNYWTATSMQTGGMRTWGYSFPKGYFPSFRLVYRFNATAQNPQGTPLPQNTLIPGNTVTVYHKVTVTP